LNISSSTSLHKTRDHRAAEAGDGPLQSPSNHGEFVGSARGKKKIQEGADVRPVEEADLAASEQLGRERAKSDDPILEHPSKR